MTHEHSLQTRLCSVRCWWAPLRQGCTHGAECRGLCALDTAAVLRPTLSSTASCSCAVPLRNGRRALRISAVAPASAPPTTAAPSAAHTGHLRQQRRTGARSGWVSSCWPLTVRVLASRPRSNEHTRCGCNTWGGAAHPKGRRPTCLRRAAGGPCRQPDHQVSAPRRYSTCTACTTTRKPKDNPSPLLPRLLRPRRSPASGSPSSSQALVACHLEIYSAQRDAPRPSRYLRAFKTTPEPATCGNRYSPLASCPRPVKSSPLSSGPWARL